MKARPSERLPIFRSPGQGALLAELFVYGDTPMSLTELAERTGLSLGGVHKEVERLEAAGIVTSHRVGRSRLVTPDTTSPYYPELQSLLQKAYGPTRLLRERLGEVAGVDFAFIYGSWAASELGEAVGQPRDIDLMVVGRPSLGELYAAVREVEETVGRPVNVTVLSPEEWEEQESGFLASLREGPKVPVA